MSDERIVIVPYDASWPAAYDREVARLTPAFADLAGANGALLKRAEHVGSTAVPGLSAKPIIDIMLGVRSLEEARTCIPRIEALGYTYVAAFEKKIPERLFFQRGSPRSHHLHVVETSSDFWANQLLFRDFLRAHPDTGKKYASIKAELAVTFAEDREGYNRAKTDFIVAVLDAARAEKRR